MQQWQPIDTAPKDGRAVLVFGRICDLWHEMESPSYIQNVFVAAYTGSEGRSAYAYWHWEAPGYLGKVEPTHWMPLPEPPQDIDINKDIINGTD